jgi:hypothetical protein
MLWSICGYAIESSDDRSEEIHANVKGTDGLLCAAIRSTVGSVRLRRVRVAMTTNSVKGFAHPVPKSFQFCERNNKLSISTIQTDQDSVADIDSR